MKRICLTKDADYDNSESKYHEHKILFYFDVDDVYTAINAHWLKINPDHIGMIGYFGNSLQSLINGILYDCHKGKLDLTIGGIDTKKRFTATGDNRMGNKEYTYFLPADKVTLLEKHFNPGYRAYKNVEELLDDIPIDSRSHLRYLRTLRDEWHVEEPSISKVNITGALNEDLVNIDGGVWSLIDLARAYERLDKDGWWRPCGKRNDPASNVKYTVYDYDTHLKALQSWD